ncbi:MAG: Xaa-Pro peptidase family protein [Anaerolineae bacterium]|nr:Xaa-Pro peptidase family protein [Anaerolineae bacterium]NUQ03312.1 aminopeptidase P family protein [Anaerolineae bacterium]
MTDSHRLDRLRAVLNAENYEVAALAPGSNFRYLTGSIHFLMERPLVLFVPKQGRPALVIPHLETELFASHGFDAEMFPWMDGQGYGGAFSAAAQYLHLDGKTVAVEGQIMRFFEVEAIRRAASDVQVIDGHHALSSIRLRKDAQEIAALRRAIQISETALARTLEQVKVGMTERQVLNYLVRAMQELGGEGLSFEPIVLAGDNSSRPHGKVRNDYTIREGDPLLFDFGCTVDGYHADITRTVFVGAPSDEHRAVYAAVLAANERGRQAARPGVAGRDVDALTAQVLRDAGYGDLIAHRTGHGLGLDIHEAPYISQDSATVLEPGMVFTIEPGLYRAGVVGIRIEDNVVVTEDGCESLSTFSRDLLIVG